MQGTFREQQAAILKQMEDFFTVYDEFTRNVSPSQWRMVGHHVTEMRNMHGEIAGFKEMTKEEKENPAIQEMLEPLEPLKLS